MQDLESWAHGAAAAGWSHLQSQAFYAQGALVLAAGLAAWALAATFGGRVRAFADQIQTGTLDEARNVLDALTRQLGLLFAVATLGVAAAVSVSMLGEAWLVRGAQGATIIFLAFGFLRRLTHSKSLLFLLRWASIALAILYIAGWLDEVTAYLDRQRVELGNFEISLYGVVRTIFFAAVLFWLGRLSSVTGQKVIRTRTHLGASAREVMARLFEIAVYAIAVLILLNVMGINLTALAVFGGALGVGVGLGLQAIASNFISGLIILLDRSIKIGDYIELEDGRSGTLRGMNLRSATLETFDGKDIMVPNEKFVTTAFTNWTRHNNKQRYSLHFQVAYDTDLPHLFQIIRQVCASHPQVMSGDHLPLAERPDAEIEKFGENGVDILVEFWMEGVDDGDNRVGGDLNLMIWQALKAEGIEIPFPQRVVRLTRDEATPPPAAPRSK